MLVLFAITKPLGAILARVFRANGPSLSPVLEPVERVIYRLTGVNPEAEQGWVALHVRDAAVQPGWRRAAVRDHAHPGVLAAEPAGLTGVSPDLAFNTAVSFTTNTNWQSYVPEVTMSYFTQMAGLACAQLRLGRHGYRHRRRADARVGPALGPLARQLLGRPRPRQPLRAPADLLVFTLVLVWQGVPQNLDAYTAGHHVEGATQTIAQGPVACQEAIKELGTNGGGFFNANSAHPFENPTPLTNFLEILSIFAIPAGLTYTFGRMVGDTRQGWAIWAAMTILFLAGVAVALPAEQAGNPLLTTARRRSAAERAADRAATSRARRSASASPPRPCSPSSPRPPPAARSTRCTTA